jgi:hypothetical protein
MFSEWILREDTQRLQSIFSSQILNYRRETSSRKAEIHREYQTVNHRNIRKGYNCPENQNQNQKVLRMSFRPVMLMTIELLEFCEQREEENLYEYYVSDSIIGSCMLICICTQCVYVFVLRV